MPNSPIAFPTPDRLAHQAVLSDVSRGFPIGAGPAGSRLVPSSETKDI